MLRSVKIKLPNVPVSSVEETIKIYVDVFNCHADWAWQLGCWSKQTAHFEIYNQIREKYPDFPSGLVQCARDCAREAVKAIKSAKAIAKRKRLNRKEPKMPQMKASSAIRYDLRTSTLRGSQLTFSTIEKRVKTIVEIPDYFKDIVRLGKFKGCQLFIRDKTVFCNLIFELADAEPSANKVVGGIDRGIINIATSSCGDNFSGKELMSYRRKQFYNRQILKTKVTRSAKRRLKALSGKEKRFSRQVNHIISKKIANLPYGIIVFEDLTKIEKDRGNILNKWLSDWSFWQLEMFTIYKAEALGKLVVFGDPRYTSQKCNACKHIHKDNRNKGHFKCLKCGNQDQSDLNAAKNIRDDYIISIHVGGTGPGQRPICSPAVDAQASAAVMDKPTASCCG